MDLAVHQRAMLGLFRATYRVSDDDEPYIRVVAQSRDLQEARGNVLMWRIYVLQRTCPLSIALLQRHGLLRRAIEDFIAQCNISLFRETQASAFLELLSGHADRLIASVAQFERALALVRQGDSRSHVINWSVEPGVVLHSLASDLPLPDELPAGNWYVTLAHDLPGWFRIDRA